MSDSRAYSQFEPPFETVQHSSPGMESIQQVGDQPYAVIRRYTGLDPRSIDVVARRVNEELVPILSQLPGFVAYFALHTGGDVVASITVFEDRDQADESTRRVAAWVKEHLSSLVPNPPQFTAGKVFAANVKGGDVHVSAV
ncbi:MAG TPA: hypothetical protein VFH48_17030 [Chloroflexota bacterium]|nr:hypothetical protein [Chloroflexota bacterium]